MAKTDPRSTMTIIEFTEVKQKYEAEINDLLIKFENETGLAIVDIDVDIQYPNEKEPTRSIDIGVAL